MILSLESWLLIGACVLALVAIGLAIVAMARQRAYGRRFERLLGAAEHGTIGDVLENYAARVEDVAADLSVGQERISALEVKGEHSLRSVGVVRYNPFADTGGDQSFAVALADGHGDGVVLSSLHSRALTRVYAKPLVGWQSPHQLSAEEQRAIEQAQAGRER